MNCAEPYDGWLLACGHPYATLNFYLGSTYFPLCESVLVNWTINARTFVMPKHITVIALWGRDSDININAYVVPCVRTRYFVFVHDIQSNLNLFQEIYQICYKLYVFSFLATMNKFVWALNSTSFECSLMSIF